MKTIILSIVFLFTTVQLFSQVDRAEKERLKMNNSILKDNLGTISNVNYVKKKKLIGSHSADVTMINGKMMVKKNGVMTLMKSNVTMRDGTIAMPNGLIYMPINGGTVIRLQEGASVDMSGKIHYNTRTLNKIIKNY